MSESFAVECINCNAIKVDEEYFARGAFNPKDLGNVTIGHSYLSEKCLRDHLGDGLPEGRLEELITLNSDKLISECPTPEYWVLVVNEDKGQREAYFDWLETMGYHVVTVEDAEQALHTLDERPYDLVIAGMEYGLLSSKEFVDMLATLHPDTKSIVTSVNHDNFRGLPNNRTFDKMKGLGELRFKIEALLSQS